MDQPNSMNLAVVTETDATALERLIDDYSAKIDQQHQHLSEELAYFQAKIRELQSIDPADNTGLGRLYRGHERRISALLDRIQLPQTDV